MTMNLCRQCVVKMSTTKHIYLKYFKCDQGYGNFGDELSPFIVSHMLRTKPYELHWGKDETKCDYTMLAIGSYLHYADEGDVVWGSGVRTSPPQEPERQHQYSDLKVHAVRGPLTRDFLMSRNISVPPVYGDPALLMPLFYRPVKIEHLKSKVGVIPHVSRVEKYRHHVADGFHVIDPCIPFSQVIQQLVSCKAIISSSLHGLILSDAYNVPNLWLNDHLDEGNFKFYDYFLSQGRQLNELNTLDEYSDSQLYKGGNHVNLTKLIQAFPF
jgi:pyruvyltransferase